MEIISLNWKEINEYMQNDVEYTFVDKVEVVPGESAKGVKLASMQDWYFKIHFPGNPIMPGVLIMEAIQQTGGLIINTLPGKKDVSLLFHGCESMRMYKEVRPGDVLNIDVVLDSYRRGIAKYHGEVRVEGNLVCKMIFTHVVPDELLKAER